MNARNFLHVLAIFFASAALSADNTSGSIGGRVNGAEISKQSAPASDAEQPPTRATCLTHCSASEARCSRDVRRARQDCSRNAASAGRDPFTGRTDYGDFCSYFANPGRNCGSDYYSRSCQARLAQRHGLCLDAMENVAALRYDCFRGERDAMNQCREELRDCKAACQ